MNKTISFWMLTPGANPEGLNLYLSFFSKVRWFAWPFFLAGVTCAVLILLVYNQPAVAQTFNDAINAQLARDPSNNRGCARLVGGSPRDGSGEPIEFGPELADICGPVIGGGSGASGGVTAGSGGTPVTGEVEKRLKETRDPNQQPTTRFSVYATGPNYENFDRDTTKFEDGYNSIIRGGTLGADVLINNSWVVGMAFDYKRWKGDFNSGGDFDTDVYSPIVYTSFFPLTGFFTDIVLSYAWKDVSNNRLRTYVNEVDDEFGGKISGEPDAEEFKVGATIGYDYPIHQFTVGPRLAFDYISTDFDGFAENGTTGLELKYDNDSRVSFQSKLGLQASMAISTSFGVIVPQIRGDWVHEYSDNQRSISVRFKQDLRDNPARFSFKSADPDRNFYEISAGLMVAMPHGIQVFGLYRTLQGHSFFDSQFATAGVRVEF